MRVPADIFQCVTCGKANTNLACEACWGSLHPDCSEIVWVVRDGQDCAHVLCKSCASEDEEGPQ